MDAPSGSRLQIAQELIVYTRAYLAVGSALLVYGLSIILQTRFSWMLSAIVGLTVFSAYAMNRKSDIAEDNVNVSFGTQELAQKTFYAGVFSLALAVMLAIIVDALIVGVIGSFIFLLFIYSVKVLPESLPYQRLKEIPFVKNAIVGGALALLFTGPLVIYNDMPVGSGSAVVFGFVFLRTFIGSVIPDIRDIEGDKRAGVDTVPVMFGVGRTKHLLFLINAVAVLMFYGAFVEGILSEAALVGGIVNLIGFPIIYYTSERNAEEMTLVTEANDTVVFTGLAIVGGML